LTCVVAGAIVGAAAAAEAKVGATSAAPTRSMDIKMPRSHPEYEESYLCTPMKLGEAQNYIVGFAPNATSLTAHHMLLYGCQNPGKHAEIFNCGAMAQRNWALPSAGHPCGYGNSQIIYAWAQDAPELALPEGVGFRVGGDSGVDWLVLQVHYATVKHIPESGDESGVTLKYTNVEQPRSAGVLFLGSNGRIPAQSTTHMEVACEIWEDVS